MLGEPAEDDNDRALFRSDIELAFYKYEALV